MSNDSEALNPETCPIEGMGATQLNSLVHILTARRLVAALRNPEVSLSPATLQAAMRFLQDNDVTGANLPDSLKNLQQAYAAKAPFKIAQ